MVEEIEDHRNPLSEGVQVGDCRILETLGKGSFGFTYKVQNVVENEPQVIKEHFPKGIGAFREAGNTQITIKDKFVFKKSLQQFKTEAVKLKQFYHPNIVKVLEYHKGNATAYFSMKYVEGLNRH